MMTNQKDKQNNLQVPISDAVHCSLYWKVTTTKTILQRKYAFHIPIYLPIIQKETFIEMQQISLQTAEFRTLVRKQTE